MSEKFTQAKKEARENGVNPDGYFEFHTHFIDKDDNLYYLTVDVWADESILLDISPGLYDALGECHKPEHDDYLARNIPAMLRNNLIWDCMSSHDDIDSVDDLEQSLDNGEVELMRY